MKMEHAPILSLAVWTALAALTGGASPAYADIIKSTKEWAGQLDDGKLEGEKPAGGSLTNQKDFNKLWRAWMGKEKPPEIDFDKELVLVATSTRGRVFGIHLIDEKGDVRAAVALMPKEVKGFTFAVAVFKREGIKTIDGKPIQK